MNKRLFLCLLVGLFWISGCSDDSSIENPIASQSTTSQTVVAAAPGKTNVCHFDDTGGSKVITVNNNALPNFVADGDCVTTAPKGTPGCNCSPASIGSFTASPDLINLHRSETSTLAWSTADATECSIDNGVGTVPCNGSTVVNPTANTVYTLTATGFVGAPDTSQVTVNIQYCAELWAARPSGAQLCPTGATQFCLPVPIDVTSSAHAKSACEVCSGQPCSETTFLNGQGWFAQNAGAGSVFLYTQTDDPQTSCFPHGCLGIGLAGLVVPTTCGCWNGASWGI